MLLKAADGSALKNETLRLFVSSGDISENQTFLTDESGRASFALDTSGWTGPVALRGHFKEAGPSVERDKVSPSYPDAHHRVESFYSRSRSFLKIRRLGGELPCDQAQRLHVDYVLARKALGNGSKSLDFIFMVVAKGAIARILHKGLKLRKGAGLKGSFSVELPVGAELAPAAKVLSYTVLPDGEMAADSALLRVAKCLPNKVKLAFSQDRALPGSELQLQVQAAPGSLCAVRAVDRSVLLMKPEAELSVDTVYNLLPDFHQEDSYQGHKSCYCQSNATATVMSTTLHGVPATIWSLRRPRRGTRGRADPLTDPNGLFQVGLCLALPLSPL
nr:alpha-2-macroglobulin-like isoform X2 [Pelodiscus sinensis]|eukprot:XP_025036373.1 alpha-2-macroglobulin-like isoform X2 [Pelodiscus sinensis]